MSHSEASAATPESGNYVVQLIDATKSFGPAPGREVLGPSTLAVPPGEFLAIVGRSGSGKSTLLSILGLLDVPTSGTVNIVGADASGLTETERARVRATSIGFVFQSFHLRSGKTALANVQTSLLYAGMPRNERADAARVALASVGLQDRWSDDVGTLSGGERQRVAVARAIAGQPQLICADEPTGNLDNANRDTIIGLLKDLASSGVAVVVVTHDHDLASQADRVITISDGRLCDASLAGAS